MISAPGASARFIAASPVAPLKEALPAPPSPHGGLAPPTRWHELGDLIGERDSQTNGITAGDRRSAGADVAAVARTSEVPNGEVAQWTLDIAETVTSARPSCVAVLTKRAQGSVPKVEPESTSRTARPWP